MSTDPKALVEKYLNENGYPFEMKVAKEFKKNGFGIGQSIYFPDPNNQISREIDVVAAWHHEVSNIQLNIIFLIECKYAKNSWILFSSLTAGLNECYSHSEGAERWLQHLTCQHDFDHFFEIERNIGYGLTVSTKETESQKDNVYKAIQTLLSFIKSEVLQPRFSKEDFVLFIPIIAIRGKLFGAQINGQDELSCKEINEAQLYYNEGLKGIVPKIHVVTEDILPEYILRLKEDSLRLAIPPFFDLRIANPPLNEM